VSQYIDFASRVGNRVFFRTATTKVKKLNASHFSTISNICHNIVGKRSKDFRFSLTFAASDKPNSIALFKRLVDWAEVKTHSYFTSLDSEDQQFVTQLWETPTLLDK